jgi:predicted transcriptional regulator
MSSEERGLLSEGAPTLDVRINEFYELAQNPKRRHALQIIAEDGEMDLTELTEKVAERMYEELTENNVKKMFVSLHQAHLSTLSESGLVEFEMEARTVGPTEKTEPAAHLISRINNAFDES